MICLDCQSKYNKNWRAGKETGFRGRYTLKHGHYVIEKYWRCPNCESINVRSDEKNRRNEMLRQDTCDCNGVPFRHRKGTFLSCIHHPKDYDDWTEEDERQMEGMLRTPRSG